jgi:hypothetical protein
MHTVVLSAAKLAIAVTLLFAGASKLLSPHPLANGLRSAFNWTRVPVHRLSHLARGVAVVEIVASLLVASGWLLSVGLALVGIVGAGIVVFTAVAMSRGRQVSCGCFGESGGKPVGMSNVMAGIALAGTY